MMMAGGVKGLPKPEPSVVPSDFEGTVFGGNAAAFFANQIQKGAQQQGAAPAGGGAQAAAVAAPVEAPPAPDVPNMFMLKIKAILLVGGFFLLLAALIVYLFITGKRESARKQIVNDARMRVEAFGRSNENRSLEPASLARSFRVDLEELKALKQSTEEKLDELKGADQKYISSMKLLKEKIEFWMFERELYLKVEEMDVDGAGNLAGEWQNKGTESQKQLAPLATYLVHFQIFRKEFPDAPELATKAPPRERIMQLDVEMQKLSEESDRNTSNTLASESYFSRWVNGVRENDKLKIALWKQFWNEWGQYEKETDPVKKKTHADKLKEKYQNLDKVKSLP